MDNFPVVALTTSSAMSQGFAANLPDGCCGSEPVPLQTFASLSKSNTSCRARHLGGIYPPPRDIGPK